MSKCLFKHSLYRNSQKIETFHRDQRKSYEILNISINNCVINSTQIFQKFEYQTEHNKLSGSIFVNPSILLKFWLARVQSGLVLHYGQMAQHGRIAFILKIIIWTIAMCQNINHVQKFQHLNRGRCQYRKSSSHISIKININVWSTVILMVIIPGTKINILNYTKSSMKCKTDNKIKNF